MELVSGIGVTGDLGDEKFLAGVVGVPPHDFGLSFMSRSIAGYRIAGVLGSSPCKCLRIMGKSPVIARSAKGDGVV